MPSSACPHPTTTTLTLHDALPISLSGLDIPMPKPLLQGPHRCARRRHCGPEGVAKIVKAVRLVQLRGLKRLAEATQDRGLEAGRGRWEEHTSELQSPMYLVCRLLRAHIPQRRLLPYTTLFRSR